MPARYYVTTSTLGIERTSDGVIEWQLPEVGSPAPAEATLGGRLVLREAAALLDVLEEVVCVAEPVGETTPAGPGEIAVSSARLTERTPWGPLTAAHFALDCAEHVLGEAGDVELAAGFTLAGAIADARSFLSANDGEPGELGRLARFSAARRLRKEGRQIGDLALQMLEQDIADELDATDDVAWTLTTAAGDAVLAAVETLRYLAAPGYVEAREQNAEREDAPIPALNPTLIETPIGPWMVGAEHDSPYLSSGALARDAAFRAREAAGEGAATEREWQAQRLEQALAG